MQLALMASAISRHRASFGSVSDENREENASADQTSVAGATARKSKFLISTALAMPVVWTLAIGAFAISWFTICTFPSYLFFWKGGRGYVVSQCQPPGITSSV